MYKDRFYPSIEMAYDSCWGSIVTIFESCKDILNHNDDFNVLTYWSRCLDSYWWWVEFKANGEHRILDSVCSQWGYKCNNVVTFVLMLLFLSMVLFDRIYKVYEMVYLWWKCHNTTVFRLRNVNSICTSSDEKDNGKEWTVVNDQCRRNSRGRRLDNWPYPT
jgi:hypothetical protein